MQEINPVVGGRYNWIGQPERLVCMGTKHYPGDPRTWHQFAKVDEPEVVWSEVLTIDMEHFVETRDAHKERIQIIAGLKMLAADEIRRLSIKDLEIEPAVLPNPSDYGKQRAQWKRETSTRFRR